MPRAIPKLVNIPDSLPLKDCFTTIAKSGPGLMTANKWIIRMEMNCSISRKLKII